MTRHRTWGLGFVLALATALFACGGDDSSTDEAEGSATAAMTCDDVECSPSEVCEELGGEREGLVGCVRGNACELGPQSACNGATNAVTVCVELADGDTVIMHSYCGEQECGPGPDGELGCFDR